VGRAIGQPFSNVDSTMNALHHSSHRFLLFPSWSLKNNHCGTLRGQRWFPHMPLYNSHCSHWMVFQQLLFHWPILKNYLPVWTSYMLEWFYSCSTFTFCLPLKVECNHMRYSYETAVLTWIWIFYGLWYPVVEFAYVVWMDQRYSNHESDICSLPWGHRNLCIWTMGISNLPGSVLT